jgi:NTP pyrophosphatase (non-canonical NTP hydrolase)
MTGNEFQELARRTLIDTDGSTYSMHDIAVIWNALGLVTEAGAVVDGVRRGVIQHHGIDKQYIRHVLGDVMWHVAALCTVLDFSLDDIMQENVEKLLDQYPDALTVASSLEKMETLTSP